MNVQLKIQYFKENNFLKANNVIPNKITQEFPVVVW